MLILLFGDNFLQLMLEAKFDGSEKEAWFGIPLFSGSDVDAADDVAACCRLLAYNADEPNK